MGPLEQGRHAGGGVRRQDRRGGLSAGSPTQRRGDKTINSLILLAQQSLHVHCI